VSGERVAILRERAHRLLSLARELAGRGMLDVAAFMAEQAAQLRLKASLLRLTGDTPRLHSLRELIGLLSQRLLEAGYREEALQLRSFSREHRGSLVDLEDAYTAARYALYQVDPETVERLFKLLEEVEKRVLG